MGVQNIISKYWFGFIGLLCLLGYAITSQVSYLKIAIFLFVLLAIKLLLIREFKKEGVTWLKFIAMVLMFGGASFFLLTFAALFVWGIFMADSFLGKVIAILGFSFFGLWGLFMSSLFYLAMRAHFVQGECKLRLIDKPFLWILKTSGDFFDLFKRKSS